MLAMASAEGMFRLLDAQPAIREPVASAPTARLQPSLSFENVNFSYRGDRNAFTLTVNQRLPPSSISAPTYTPQRAQMRKSAVWSPKR